MRDGRVGWGVLRRWGDLHRSIVRGVYGGGCLTILLLSL